MLNYWVSFVRTAFPTAPGETAWPRFTAQERGYLDIDERPTPSATCTRPPSAGPTAWSMSRRAARQAVAVDIGFSAFPAVSVDAPDTNRQPEAR
jgi:para-nitrobenzyl esterase